MLEFLILVVYLIVGLLISSYWFRRRRRLGTNDPTEDPWQAIMIVFAWPLFFAGWPVARMIKWLYLR